MTEMRDRDIHHFRRIGVVLDDQRAKLAGHGDRRDVSGDGGRDRCRTDRKTDFNLSAAAHAGTSHFDLTVMHLH
jgi:hypothetical protein